MKRVALALALALTAPTLQGCTEAQFANVLSTFERYIGYVSSFVQGAQVVWSIISPLLASNVQVSANSQFARALQGVTDAEAAMQDADAAARAANNPNPDFTVVIAQCQAAVKQVMAVFALYQTPASGVGLTFTSLERQAAYIEAWR